MVELFNTDLLLDYLLILISASWVVFSFKIFYNYRKTNQFIPWLFIFVSMVLFFASEIVYVYLNTFFSELDFYALIPTDAFWLLSYLFFGIGVLIYYNRINKRIKKGFQYTDIIIIVLISLIIFFIGFRVIKLPLAGRIIYSLHLCLGTFASLSCTPIMFLFKGGNMARNWLYLSSSMLLFMMGIVLFLLESYTVSLYSFSSLVFLLASLMLSYSLYKLLTLKH